MIPGDPKFSLNSRLKSLLLVSTITLLTACGGGSDNSDSSQSDRDTDTNQTDTSSQGDSSDQDDSTEPDDDSDSSDDGGDTAGSLDLRNYFFTSYGSGEDTSGDAQVSDTGNQLSLNGNRWLKFDQNITITPDTVLEFDFESDTEGEIHGLGFDTDNELSPNNIFQVYGTENWGVTGAYRYSGSGKKHITIPVGEYFTGEFSRMVFINDEDRDNPQSDSQFSNIVLRNAEMSSSAIVLEHEDFDDLQQPSDWTIGTQLGGQLDFSNGYAAGQYPVPDGESYIWFNKTILDEQISEVYVQFRARMPDAKHGLKFLKIFGEKSGGGYANVTYGLDYTGIDNGSFYSIGFGDGSTVTNDTQNIIVLSGALPKLVGRSYGSAMVKTPQNEIFSSDDWGDDWHEFKMYFKFNSGTTAANEVADGAIYLEIDGKVYVDAKGVFNRHYSNSLYIQKVGLFGWSQAGTESFAIDYDDVIISKDGFAIP
ncbi:hypothetical protein [Hahella ganghwensis]|uniref:hypothetical protein n=1 Tax=Hahella ganghwensis TaxID=286420 RepID=UPI00035D9ED3|nr:hypothetical protein [Hahella ganghwensis]